MDTRDGKGRGEARMEREALDGLGGKIPRVGIS